MPSLSENVENRVRKLPKPSNAAQALQPVFEAVSNSYYAIEDRFNDDALEKGAVSLTIENLADDCVFYCFVVADIVGDLDQQLSSWQTTSNGRGRFRPLENKYRGFIEVIQWRDLVNDAWRRNEATLNAAGLRRGANNP